MVGRDSISIHLPEDLLLGIMVLLPVVSLLRFKSVTKSWRSLIESSDFIDRYNASMETPKSSQLGNFIVQAYREESHLGFRNHFFMLSGSDDFEVVEDLGLPTHFKDNTGPFSHVGMVGSCEGIVCIYGSRPREIALWNPTTKQSRLLPQSSDFHTGRGHGNREFIGFGFDMESKDCKVVIVTEMKPFRHFPRRCESRRCQVYSLNSDSWKDIDVGLGISCTKLSTRDQGRYLNGSYFLLGEVYDPHRENHFQYRGRVENMTFVIVAFDFSKETFRTIQVPDECRCLTRLSVVDDKICIIHNVYHDYGLYDARYGVWVLNNYCHDNECWSKLYTIGPLSEDNYNHDVLLAFTKNGESAIILDDVLKMYNINTKETKGCQFDESVKVSSTIDMFKRSLFSISGNHSATTAANVE